ncbi:hypothetical protein GT044_35255 [Streptomyces sp. SID335]|uniref:Uncharacterized protein n=1 Tax=Streptomyces venezuelae TaxID=54571 RepID=A0A5P2CG46_STRVZ|nr:hypothetical protein [Streptomyces sp. SID335]MYZ17939.1 hypothetical protein [Streptomyces sp. SID337]QES26745.1 hypothetical protein DEJ47_09910 [Streptomyces venezuelae]QES41197.1 hypothetical protein DEJ49_09400 [Streptomyces venezuelae]
MPSLTVVVSSDTDICFSPGLYGDCLPTVATGGAADSFRAERLRLTPSCSHMARRGTAGRRTANASHRHYGHRQTDTKRL